MNRLYRRHLRAIMGGVCVAMAFQVHILMMGWALPQDANAPIGIVSLPLFLFWLIVFGMALPSFIACAMSGGYWAAHWSPGRWTGNAIIVGLLFPPLLVAVNLLIALLVSRPDSLGGFSWFYARLYEKINGLDSEFGVIHIIALLVIVLAAMIGGYIRVHSEKRLNRLAFLSKRLLHVRIGLRLLKWHLLSGYVFALAAYFLYMWWENTVDKSILAIGVIALITSTIGGIGRFVLAWENRAVQGAKDLDAATILREVKTSDSKVTPPRFFLYLRPFHITGKMPMETDTKRAIPLSPKYYEPALEDLESAIESTLRPLAPLIGLGMPGEAVGAGRILSQDTEWQSEVVSLADKASIVLVIPSAAAGTKWEIEWLSRNNYLGKCIFLMPPRGKPEEIQPDELWLHAKAALEELGITLPVYNPSGALFKLDSSGKVAALREYGEVAVREMAKGIIGK